MYSPVLETVPPVADQVTAVFVLPVTVALNCCVPETATFALAGLTLTLLKTWLTTTFTVLADRTVRGPAGAFGGHDGLPAEYVLIRGGEETRLSPPELSMLHALGVPSGSTHSL